MADNSGNTFLGVVLGGAVAVLLIIGFVAYNGGNFGGGGGSNIKIEVPKAK